MFIYFSTLEYSHLRTGDKNGAFPTLCSCDGIRYKNFHELPLNVDTNNGAELCHNKWGSQDRDKRWKEESDEKEKE